MKKYAIIVAGGTGTRMGADIPKQFLKIGSKPVLIHTLEVFHQADCEIKLILILPSNQKAYWKELIKKYDCKIPHDIVEGGETRFHSVKNGLIKVEGQSLVAVHDGVRPLVPVHIIKESYNMAAVHGSAVASVALKDSIRKVSAGDNEALNRSNYRLIQTPQVFNSLLLQKAYQKGYRQEFTDDASVFEASGNSIRLVEGSYENLKITTPEDLEMAEVIFNRRNQK